MQTIAPKPKIENQIRSLELQLELLQVQQNLSDTDLQSVDSNRYTLSCILNPKLQEEGVPIMSTAGTIRTKQRCEVCNSKFIDTDQLMVCPECLKKQKISIPNRFYLDIFWNAKQRKIYSDNDGRVLNNYELANRVLIEIRQKIDKHKFDPADYVAKNYVALQFDNYAKSFFWRLKEAHARGKYSPNTIKSFEKDINIHIIPHFKTQDIRDVRDGDLEDFYLKLPKNLSLATQKHIFATLHLIFKSAKKRKDISSIPDFPVIKVPDPQTRWIDENDQSLIYNHIPDHHKPIFLFMMRQGVRPGEARALHWEDIDWENRTVEIHRTFAGHVCQMRTKTKTNRILPLDEDVYNMLLKKRGVKGIIFITKRGAPYFEGVILNHVWGNAIKKAGLNHISLYEGTRHSFLSQAANAGVEAFQLQKFAGHSNSKTTEKYIHINTEGLKMVLDIKKGKILKLAPGTSPRVALRKKAGVKKVANKGTTGNIK